MKVSELSLGKYEAQPHADAAPELHATFAAKRRLKLLNATGITATPLEQETVLGNDDRVEAAFIDRCLLVRSCIGRISVQRPGSRGWATGFLVGPGLVLTNHHVFKDASSVGSSRIAFDYWVDVNGRRPTDPDEFEFRADQFFVASEALDYALVQVSATSLRGDAIAGRRHLRLIRGSGKVKTDEFVTILQHPSGEPMQIALRENKVTRADDGEPFIWYQADTAHGSSGAPVFNDQFQVVGLHASGRIKRDAEGRYALASGGWTTSLDGLEETDVNWETNVGYRASRIADDLLAQAQSHWPARAHEIEAAMAGGDVMSSPFNSVTRPVSSPASQPNLQEEVMTAPTAKSHVLQTAPSHELVIPLQLRVSLELLSGQQPAVVNQEARGSRAQSMETESWQMRMPVIYDDIESRPGFNSEFLVDGQPVPMPKVTAAGKKKLAPLLDGSGTELKYMHFSVWTHKERRLALYTAANVDWTARKKTVDGQSTSRDGLAGWPGEDHVELWANEERIAAEHQLPDEFYTSDRGAFDKGHIVRRDDVCWGTTFEEIQMANGDTFHVSNCSPQHKVFNQGQHGQENWGDLESAVQKITKGEKEKACIFAGPVFGASDRWFRGTDGHGEVRIQVPSRFWKIVVVKNDQDFDAYGFVLEQDVRAVTEKEFYVSDEWTAAWKPISDIQKLMRGWLDLSAIAAFDRHG